MGAGRRKIGKGRRSCITVEKRKLACTCTKRADLNKWEESGGQSRPIGQMEEEEGIGYLIIKA